MPAVYSRHDRPVWIPVQYLYALAWLLIGWATASGIKRGQKPQRKPSLKYEFLLKYVLSEKSNLAS